MTSKTDLLYHFLVREGLSNASMYYGSPLYFNEDELLRLRATAPLLYSYYTLYPKDPRGFWLLDSLGRWIGTEIEKSASGNMRITKRGRVKIEHLPFPFFMTKSDHERVRRAISRLPLMSEPDDIVKEIEQAYSDIVLVLSKMVLTVYHPFVSLFGVSNRDFDMTVNKILSSYSNILEYFGFSTNLLKFRRFQQYVSADSVIDEVGARLYPKEQEIIKISKKNANNFIDFISNSEISCAWRYETRKNPKLAFYAPVGFHRVGADITKHNVASTTLSDFYLHFIYPAEEANYAESVSESGYEKEEKILLKKNSVVIYDTKTFRTLQYLFFYSYNAQLKSKISSIIKDDEKVDRIKSIVRSAEKAATFIDLIDSEVNAVYATVKRELDKRLQKLFEHEDFLRLKKQEQMLYVMANLKHVFLEEKEKIHAIRGKDYAKIRSEKILEKMSELLNDSFRAYYSVISRIKEENSEDKAPTGNCETAIPDIPDEEVDFSADQSFAEPEVAMPSDYLPDDNGDDDDNELDDAALLGGSLASLDELEEVENADIYNNHREEFP